MALTEKTGGSYRFDSLTLLSLPQNFLARSSVLGAGNTGRIVKPKHEDIDEKEHGKLSWRHADGTIKPHTLPIEIIIANHFNH